MQPDLLGNAVLAEGPTDTATILDMGFEAVGRPEVAPAAWGCSLTWLAGRVKDIVIVADVDPHGAGRRRGGVAGRGAGVVPAVDSRDRTPGGIKDVRDWRRAGAEHDDIMAAVEATPARRLVVRSKRIQPGRRLVHHG